MTNEEKARGIGTTIWEEWKDATLATGAEKGANLMAEWKDKQFKEYLEKRLCDAKSVYEMSHHEDYVGGFMDAISEIINELFGGE